jgi:DNA-binding NtrC family response regulator
VDDEHDAAEMMAALIAAEGYTVAIAGSLAAARRQMALRTPNVVLLDLVLPDGSGMDLVADIKAVHGADVVLITGHASVETSVQALRMGAADYLTKPLNLQQLRGVLSRVRRPYTLKHDAQTLADTLEAEGHFGLLWGCSAPMRQVHQQILRVSGTGITVFVTGESGTFMRVGASQSIETDVRLIAATNRDPVQAVAERRLREDLFYRLKVFPIHIPPLRERRDDIPLLANHFMADISRREGMAKRFSAACLERLTPDPWPGNVRAAQHRAARLCDGPQRPDGRRLPAGGRAARRSSGRRGHAERDDPGGHAAGRSRAPDPLVNTRILRPPQREDSGRTRREPEDAL